METPQPPIIIPMWITGFDKLMPEGRRFPFKFMPRLGAQLSVTFGDPIPPSDILTALRRETKQPLHEAGVSDSSVLPKSSRWVNVEAAEKSESETIDKEIRIAVTNVVQRAVEAVGRRVSGDSLGSPNI
jgi:monolysocardiolipin acyltransferase